MSQVVSVCEKNIFLETGSSFVAVRVADFDIKKRPADKLATPGDVMVAIMLKCIVSKTKMFFRRAITEKQI